METSTGQPAHLRDYLGIVLKRKWTVLFFLVVLVAIVTATSLKKAPVYQSTCQLLIEKERPDAVSFKEVIGIDTVDRDYYQTQYKILQSRALAKSVIAKLGLEHIDEFSKPKLSLVASLKKAVFKKSPALKPLGIESVVNRFLSAITIEPVSNTRLVKINTRSHDPELAAAIANTLAGAYIQQNWESKLFSSRQVLNQLFPETGPIKLQSNDGDLSELFLSLPSVVNHDLIKKLKEDCAKLEVKYAGLNQRYGPKHPKMISVKSALDKMRANIDLETRRIVASVKTELSGNFKSNNIRTIDPASVSKLHIYPKTRLNIILSIISGIVLGCGLAFFLEYLDSTVKKPEDIENFLGLPFLGHIPHIKSRGRKRRGEMYNLVQTQPNSLASEAFRNIRTRLTFSNGNSSKTTKTILVSSAGPAEGKTLVSTNLASSLAQAGDRVLLVDADMRRPSVHKNLHLDNAFGFSDYLKQNMELDQIIQQNSIENLKIITSGPAPSNPSELLSSVRISEFTEALGDEFDWIIFDAPPISVSDAVILAKSVEGVVQVVHSSKYHKNMVNQARQRLEDLDIKIIGGVLNNISLEKSGYSYYSSYYYYGGYYHTKDKSKKTAAAK